MYNNLDRIYEKLVEQYNVVQTCTIDDEIYMYKLLNKLEYETLTSQIDDELDLQDAIVENCVLYPENLDIDDMLPGVVYELSKIVIEQSCVMPEDRLLMLELFTSEMTQLDNVIICLIMRAFPAYKLNELESMTYPELYKLYSRAEWFLINVLQEPLEFSAIDSIKTALYGNQENNHSDYYNNGHDEELDEDGNPISKDQEPATQEQGRFIGRNLNEVMSEINNSGSKRAPMTEEQKRELEKFKQQFPDINMSQDAMYTGLLSETAGVVRNAPRKKF